MNQKEIEIVINKLEEDYGSHDVIKDKLRSAANNDMFVASSVAAGKMGEYLGREVSATEAQNVAKAVLKFTDKNFNGNTQEAAKFVREVNRECPALGKKDIVDLINSGAADRLKEMKDSDPEKYHETLAKMNGDPSILASLKQGRLLSSTQGQQEPALSDIDQNSASNLLGGTLAFLTDNGRLPEGMENVGRKLINNALNVAFGEDSHAFGNAPEMIEKVAQKMGFDAHCHIDHPNGSAILHGDISFDHSENRPPEPESMA